MGTDADHRHDTSHGVTVHVTVMPQFGELVSPELVSKTAETTVVHAGAGNVQLGVVITDDADIHGLNLRFRNVDRPTDVLSFALRDNVPGVRSLSLPPGEPEPLGDVVVSYPRAVEQARDIGHAAERELVWLIIHGTLQLLGYQHDTPEETAAMREQERAILVRLGYPPEAGG